MFLVSEDVVSKARHCIRSTGLPVLPLGRGWRKATLAAVTLFKSASIVSLLTLISRITGLVRELLIAATFGASALTDAFNVAFRIPNLFRRLFGEGAFSQAFVPVLAASKVEHGDAETQVLINRTATLMAWVLFLISAGRAPRPRS